MDATSLAALALNQIVNYTACVEVFNLDPSVCNTDYIEPQLYQMSLEKTIYDGFTGPIRFLGGSLALEYSTFDVRQIGTNGKIKTVGFTNITNSYLEASLLTFKQPVPQPEPPAPKTDYPSSVIAPEEIDISDTRIILSTIFSFIILLVVVALMISIYFQRDSPKVKGIGFIWVEMLFFAIIMMAISKISSSLVSESTARCITVSTLDLTGWGLFTGCFLQKAFRYFGILMNFKNYPQLVLPETNELKVFLQVLMFSIPLVVLMAMYFGDALQATIMPTTSPYAEYYACKTIDQSYGNGIAYTATAYIGITLLVTTLVFIFSMRVGIRRSKIKADELKLLILIATNVLIVYILFSPYYYTLTAVPGALFEQYILRILCTHLAIVISIFEVVYYLGVGFFTFWLKKSREAINNEVMDENFRRSLDTSRSGQSNYGDRTSSLTETDESTLPSSHSETTIMSGSRSTIMHDDQSEIESGITVLEE